MSQITRGPRPIEDVAVGYAVDLYNRLRCERGWRADAFMLLSREYARFVRMTIAGEFDVVAMWEYGWLVEATHQYLCFKESRHLFGWFHTKARADLQTIGTLLNKLPFSDDERASMGVAYDRMAPIIKMWETPKARE